ncbi:MAG: hypothetical protein R6V60_01765 [Desulfobacterales bacterium]
MNRRQPPHGPAAAVDSAARRSTCRGLPPIAAASVMLLSLVACVTVGGPTDRERTSLRAGEKAVVLLRVACTIDGAPYPPFAFSTAMDNISFGLGTFETVGEPAAAWHRFLSEESRREGWAYFLLPPGLYYLSVRPAQRGDAYSYERMLHATPRWKIDIPDDARLIYAGTLQLTGEGDRLLFGGSIIRSIQSIELSVGDDAAAGRLLSENFPGLGEVKTIPMQRWDKGDPIIIRSPKPRSPR